MKWNWILTGLGLVALVLAVGCSPGGVVEQIIGGPEGAAKEAFEQWAQQAGIPYRDVRYQTLSDDGTYATVRIVAYFREAAQADWLENEAEIECRKVGAEWQCETWMYFQLSPAEQQRIEAAQQATATAQLVQAQATASAQASALATAQVELRLLGKIAFVSDRDDYHGEIYVMGADGSNLSRLTENREEDQEPAWAPDGRRIAWSCGWYFSREICLMNADGSSRQQLTENRDWEGDPAWSPDGQKIAFGFHEAYTDEMGLRVMNVDSHYVNELSGLRSDAFSAIAWSPDGERIVFAHYGGDPAAYTAYMIDADGSNLIRLFDSTAFVREFAWSPDGQKIAFVSDRDGNREIYLMDTNGGNQIRLTYDPANDDEPTWSPDGRKIAFASNRDGNYEIYVMDADGSNEIRLTDNPASDTDPAWSPAR